MPRSMSDLGRARPRACDPPSTTALIPRMAPSCFASDHTSSRCSVESCFTVLPPWLPHGQLTARGSTPQNVCEIVILVKPTNLPSIIQRDLNYVETHFRVNL